MIQSTVQNVRNVLAEPAIADAPDRTTRDGYLLGATLVVGTLEALLRTDEEWAPLPVGWRIAAWLVFLAAVPALLVRRTEPLAATTWIFALAMVLNVAIRIRFGHPGGLMSTAVVLVAVYALYRWGSGQQMLWGFAVIVGAWSIGNLVDTGNIGDWIGGFIFLTIPVEAGLIVRYRSAHAARVIDEARSRERHMLARELHDSVAHHVSAIAVQAQAGQAVAAHDPSQAVASLAVIEEAAARTLDDMRQMIGALRDDDGAELVPQQGLNDLPRLARTAPGDLAVDIDVDPAIGAVGTTVGAAVYRIAQEAITNASRHAAAATKVQVTVEPAGTDVAVEVIDDGGPAQRRDTGFGLRGMAERAQLLGGSFSAGPRAGGGWQVRATIPRSPA